MRMNIKTKDEYMYQLRISLTVVFALLALTMTARSSKSKTSGNPIVQGWYADPEAAIFGNKYWVFPTYSAKYEDQTFFDAFSSSDLLKWQEHRHIIDTTDVKWAKRALWAPSIVLKGDKYFLFFSANDIQAPFRNGYVAADNKAGGIGIGVADKPEGPYKDYLGKPLVQEFYNKAQPIDQFVFRDSDGQYYLIYGGWGHCNIARLNDDFTGLIPFPDGNLVKEITPEGYVEGPVMFVRKGKYYLMWSEGAWTNDTYKVAYSIADSPLGPFRKIDTILQSDPKIATGAGHHSVVNIPGTDEWLIFYHRRPIPNEGRDHREVCVDQMYFNSDGTIKPVIMTREGVKRTKLK